MLRYLCLKKPAPKITNEFAPPFRHGAKDSTNSLVWPLEIVTACGWYLLINYGGPSSNTSKVGTDFTKNGSMEAMRTDGFSMRTYSFRKTGIFMSSSASGKGPQYEYMPITITGFQS